MRKYFNLEAKQTDNKTWV